LTYTRGFSGSATVATVAVVALDGTAKSGGCPEGASRAPVRGGAPPPAAAADSDARGAAPPGCVTGSLRSQPAAHSSVVRSANLRTGYTLGRLKHPAPSSFEVMLEI